MQILRSPTLSGTHLACQNPTLSDTQLWKPYPFWHRNCQKHTLSVLAYVYSNHCWQTNTVSLSNIESNIRCSYLHSNEYKGLLRHTTSHSSRSCTSIDDMKFMNGLVRGDIRSHRVTNLHVPKTKRVMFEAWSLTVAELWNSLPHALRSQTDLDELKILLKTAYWNQ